jgi:hypothetical protein
MATQEIKWKPSTSPNIVAYEILKSDTGQTGTYDRLTLVLHQIPGSNWNSTENCFYYTDMLIPYRWYRLRILDRYGNIAEDSAPTPFQAGNSPVDVPSLYFVALNENTGGQNNLQYVTQGGTPIVGATIRVYKKIDWDIKNYSKVVGTTITVASGGWQTPIFSEVGETYTVVFNKPNEYGPDTVEITV